MHDHNFYVSWLQLQRIFCMPSSFEFHRQDTMQIITVFLNEINVLYFRHGNRQDIVVATKCRFDRQNVWAPNQRTPNRFGLSRKHIIEAVGEALGRLQTNYIDLFQVRLTHRSLAGKSYTSIR